MLLIEQVFKKKLGFKLIKGRKGWGAALTGVRR